jgi:sterol 3beta-glucosyltransferase
MKILLLTVGTRGDVEPFMALGKGLRERGHDVTVCTTEGFAPFVERHGLRYAYLNNELVELTTAEVGRKGIEDFGGGPLGKTRWIVEAARRFKPIFRRLLAEQWTAAQGTELVVFHPNAVGGIHIAEALGVPGIMADPMPTWVPTGEFPNFVFPALKLGARYNRLTYRVLPALTRGMYGSVVARWRRETLGLPPRSFLASDLERSDRRAVPVLQCFSPQVVPRPRDWPATVIVTGYWFLEETSEWQPSEPLLDFLESGPPPVFVGFGSMAGRDPATLGRTVLESLHRAGQRAIVVTGWGGIQIADPPADVFVIDSAPYAWLLPRVAAVVHHGGAGTTAAGLRAGKPSVVCPFVADQPFWGARVAALGAGPQPIPQRTLTPDRLAAAIRTAVMDARMQQRAARLGMRIRAEDGVRIALAHIERFARH